jgi:hypothetical protein
MRRFQWSEIPWFATTVTGLPEADKLPKTGQYGCIGQIIRPTRAAMYKTRQNRAGCQPGLEEFRYAFFEVPIPSK